MVSGEDLRRARLSQRIGLGQLARMIGRDKGHLSRVETGKGREVTPALVRDYEKALGVTVAATVAPMEGPGVGDTVIDMRRRDLLGVALAVAVSAGAANLEPASALLGLGEDADAEPAEWLAWQLWQRHSLELDASLVPGGLRPLLTAHPDVVYDIDGSYRLADPALIDVLVGRLIFDDIQAGNSHLLATAQTSHRTDLWLGRLAADDEAARRGLAAWMSHGATPVLRVNAAGVLAKIGTPELGDAVISALLVDREARQLYLTAVVSRVLGVPWHQASHIAAWADARSDNLADRLADGQGGWAAQQLVAEITSPRDSAARWCSTVLLSGLDDHAPAAVRDALARAARDEPCRENLRAYAAILAGTSPIT